MAGQYTLPLAGQSFLQSAGAPIVPIANTPSVQNTNTSPNAPFNPLSLASWETYGNEVPGYLASTFGSLISPFTAIFNPGTPGGQPTAGGQFPYNYPITQSDINRLALTNPALAQGIQNQYNQLRLLSGNAYQLSGRKWTEQYIYRKCKWGGLYF